MKIMSDEEAGDEDFVRGFDGILNEEKLKGMSFVLLASLLSSCDIGSAKFKIVEREKYSGASPQTKQKLIVSIYVLALASGPYSVWSVSSLART